MSEQNNINLPKIEYYTLEEAAKELGCTVQNLLHWGALGKLEICARFFGEDLSDLHQDKNADYIDPRSSDGQMYPEDVLYIHPKELLFERLNPYGIGAQENEFGKNFLSDVESQCKEKFVLVIGRQGINYEVGCIVNMFFCVVPPESLFDLQKDGKCYFLDFHFSKYSKYKFTVREKNHKKESKFINLEGLCIHVNIPVGLPEEFEKDYAIKLKNTDNLFIMSGAIEALRHDKQKFEDEKIEDEKIKDSNNGNIEWKEKAREMAIQIKEENPSFNLDRIAKIIAKEFRKEGIRGNLKPLSEAYIKRHALQNLSRQL